MNLTEHIKAALWDKYGSPSHPAEWDGNIYGGGKLSQRFWEYHQTAELLDLSSDSVLLDIGGGSPEKGAGFFTTTLATFIKRVHVIDVNVGDTSRAPKNVTFHKELADYATMSRLLRRNPQISHIACVSVFEHIPDEPRRGIVTAINENFEGGAFVTTLEFHAKKCFFEHQLTTRTLSRLFEPLSKFYPDIIRSSPFWCENAFRSPSVGSRIMRRLRIGSNRIERLPETPLWYPVSLRFRRKIPAIHPAGSLS